MLYETLDLTEGGAEGVYPSTHKVHGVSLVKSNNAVCGHRIGSKTFGVEYYLRGQNKYGNYYVRTHGNWNNHIPQTKI